MKKQLGYWNLGYAPKTTKMVNGRLKGGFPDYESEIGRAINIAIEALKQSDKKVSSVPYPTDYADPY